jgi:hypothetical protein
MTLAQQIHKDLRWQFTISTTNVASPRLYSVYIYSWYHKQPYEGLRQAIYVCMNM